MNPLRCGRYSLHERLNAGGMAEIFLGSSSEGNTVVVRRLLSQFKFNLSKRREFSRGLKIQSHFNHPNIVKIYELATLRIIPYAAMEYINGMNLRQTITHKKTTPFKQLLMLFQQMVDGLEHIHQRGYLHLDFKPENVLISPHKVAKIIDFDLAEPILKEPKAQSKINGTPAYLAPEQILRTPVDERTDIFALGITAYELFTGQKPFVAQTREDIFRANSNLKQPFPSPHSINPSIPRSLNRILSHCIEKKSDRRYPTASIITRDLNKVMVSTHKHD